jgi:N-methylhydantoinase B/oxoprolinase/acetone carboxylase alpha subunit
VDVVFKAFKTCAGSQGCMNNITFGDESVGYYETIAGGAGAVRTQYRDSLYTVRAIMLYRVLGGMEEVAFIRT